jgi:hypothetical protein
MFHCSVIDFQLPAALWTELASSFFQSVLDLCLNWSDLVLMLFFFWSHNYIILQSISQVFAMFFSKFWHIFFVPFHISNKRKQQWNSFTQIRGVKTNAIQNAEQWTCSHQRRRCNIRLEVTTSERTRATRVAGARSLRIHESCSGITSTFLSELRVSGSRTTSTYRVIQSSSTILKKTAKIIWSTKYFFSLIRRRFRVTTILRWCRWTDFRANSSCKERHTWTTADRLSQ